MKLVCISDTHNKHEQLELPEGDMLIHAGDFTDSGTREESMKFLKWFSEQTHPYKILVAGNHDFYFEKLKKVELNLILPSNVIYLQDEAVEIDGLKFWGSPFTPGRGRWAFQKLRGENMRSHWENIPGSTDILITHTPAYGIMDSIKNDVSVGCSDLLKRLQNVQPRLHIFGHIHENYGVQKKQGIKHLNCSILDETYNYIRPAVEIEIT